MNFLRSCNSGGRSVVTGCLVFTLGLISHATYADVEYRYEGNFFSVFSCGGANQGCTIPDPALTSYTTSDRVLISLRFDERLPSNRRLLHLSLVPGFSLTASDGHQVLNFTTQAAVSTDDDGNIIAPWDVVVVDPLWPSVRNLIFTNFFPGGATCCTSGAELNSLTPDLDWAIAAGPSTWSIHVEEGIDLAVKADSIRVAQSVYDPDALGDDAVDLVLNKETMIEARVFLENLDRELTPDERAQKPFIEAKIEGTESKLLFPIATNDSIASPTLGDLEDADPDGVLVRFFYAPVEEGNQEIQVSIEHLDENTIDPDASNNIAPGAEESFDVDVHFTQYISALGTSIVKCDNNNIICYAAPSQTDIDRVSTVHVELVRDAFPVPPGGFDVAFGSGIIGSSDQTILTDSQGNELGKGLRSDLIEIGKNLKKSTIHHRALVLVSKQYFDYHFKNNPLLQTKRDIVGFVAGGIDSKVAFVTAKFAGTTPHELIHTFRAPSHTQSTPLRVDGFNAQARLLISNVSNLYAPKSPVVAEPEWIATEEYEFIFRELASELPIDPKVMIISGVLTKDGEFEILDGQISDTGFVTESSGTEFSVRGVSGAGDELFAFGYDPDFVMIFLPSESVPESELGNYGEVDVAAIPIVLALPVEEELDHLTMQLGSNDPIKFDIDELLVQTFRDVPVDYWAFSFIETLAASGITVGCGGENYCPEDPVTRAQMAVFLERGMRGSDYVPPPATGNVFLDVSAAAFAAAFIEQFFLDSITSGCGGNNYCPNDAVTRAQMAVFLLRAAHGAGFIPPPASGVFTDVPLGSFAVAWIEQLAAEGITSGCGGGNYCPNDPATRAQMAVFLVRTFGL